MREYANLPGRTATASPSTPHISETEPKTVVHQRLQIQDAIRSILSAALLAGAVSRRISVQVTHCSLDAGVDLPQPRLLVR